MARKRKEDGSPTGDETIIIDTSGDSSDEFVDTTTQLIDQAPLIGDVTGTRGERDPVPPPQRFRVKNGGKIMNNGSITLLRPGKEVTEHGYNLKELRDQGIELELVQ